MINKRIIIRIFTIIFTINIFYFMLYTSHADGQLTVNTNSVTVGVGEESNAIQVKFSGAILGQLTPKITGLPNFNNTLDVFSYGDVTVRSQPDDALKRWLVWIKGVSPGKVSVVLRLDRENVESSPITVTVTGEAKKNNLEEKNSSEEKTDQQAKSQKGDDSADKTEAQSINVDITSPDFINEFNPKQDGGDVISEPFITTITDVVNRILGLLQVFGAVILVLSIAAAGLNGIIATNEGLAEDLDIAVGTSETEYRTMTGVAQPLNKKAVQKIIRRTIIGGILLLMSSSIVRFVFNLVSSI